MKLLNCPVNGLRPISEFAYWGERRMAPDPELVSDEAWSDYVFKRNGAPGTKVEWWCHTPSTTWFFAERDTEQDRVLRTWLPGAAE